MKPTAGRDLSGNVQRLPHSWGGVLVQSNFLLAQKGYLQVNVEVSAGARGGSMRVCWADP